MPDKPSAQPASAETPPIAKSHDAYHHGDLRAALIAACREALETTAPEAITLKSLALRLGVSQPAPYRHFQSRDALLAAVAADGFVRFRETLVAARDGAPVGEQSLRTALAYLEFGRANRGVYQLMFASSLLKGSEDEALDQTATAAFDFLIAGIPREAPTEKIYPIAVWIWSTLHGLVMLEAAGLTTGKIADHVSAADVVRQMLETLSSSLPVSP